MSPDTAPPPGGDTGAHRPTEENPQTAPPDSADPYAGLALGDLYEKLREKGDREEREKLIRELTRAPEEPAPPLRTQSQRRISLQALDNIAKGSGRARRK